MRQFAHPNMENFLCPICQTKADKPVVLVGIKEPEENGIVECKQVHSECWILYNKMRGIDVVVT